MKLPPSFLIDSINLHLDLHFLSHLSIKMVLISFCFRIAEYPKLFKINSSPSTCPLNYIHSRLGWDLVTRSQPLRFDVTQQTSCSCWLWRWRDLGFCTVSLSGSQAIGSEMFSFFQTQFCQLYSENITAGTSQERGEEWIRITDKVNTWHESFGIINAFILFSSSSGFKWNCPVGSVRAQ